MYALWSIELQRFLFSIEPNGGFLIDSSYYERLFLAHSEGSIIAPDDSGYPVAIPFSSEPAVASSAIADSNYS
ncbi:hypothetical protein ACV1D9_20225 [Aeromonas allosaccharophila]